MRFCQSGNGIPPRPARTAASPEAPGKKADWQAHIHLCGVMQPGINGLTKGQGTRDSTTAGNTPRTAESADKQRPVLLRTIAHPVYTTDGIFFAKKNPAEPGFFDNRKTAVT